MIHVGVAGWAYRDWEGIVYPRKKGRGFHGLGHLAGFLDLMEVNSSFYALPRPEHAESWLERTRREPGQEPFRFTAKLHQGFTHGEPLDDAAFAQAAVAFQESLAPLHASDRFSALLAQFPVSLARTPEAERRLARLAEAFTGWKLALELRHRTWFEPDALESLRGLGVSLLHIDLPSARDHPPERFPATGPLGYLRLHGRNANQWFRRGAGRDARYDYLYDEAELDHVEAVTRGLAEEHDEVLVVTNNHFEGQAVVNALELRARLEGDAVAAPAELVQRYPRLDSCTRRRGQGELF